MRFINEIELNIQYTGVGVQHDGLFSLCVQNIDFPLSYFISAFNTL